MVAKYVRLSFVAVLRYKTAGGPPVENNPPSIPPSPPDIIPFLRFALIVMRLLKNRE